MGDAGVTPSELLGHAIGGVGKANGQFVPRGKHGAELPIIAAKCLAPRTCNRSAPKATVIGSFRRALACPMAGRAGRAHRAGAARGRCPWLAPAHGRLPR